MVGATEKITFPHTVVGMNSGYPVAANRDL
jgi:hypothetical protein